MAYGANSAAACSHHESRSAFTFLNGKIVKTYFMAYQNYMKFKRLCPQSFIGTHAHSLMPTAAF